VPLYSRDHVWVSLRGARARVGISDYAQRELGDIAYVQLPEEGRRLARGEAACTIESLKSSSEVYAPLSGTVIGANDALSAEENCGLVNRDPLGEGWLFELEASDRGEIDALLTDEQYAAYLRGE
jgi:glycine cleavage system H protein